jgi:hypothetical protein
MDWIRLTNPNSPVPMILKIVAGASFAILGLLFIISDGQLIEGIILISASGAWLFFIIWNYRKQRIDLESLR